MKKAARCQFGAFLAVFALLLQTTMPMAPGALSTARAGGAFLPNGAICSQTAPDQTPGRGSGSLPSEHCPVCFVHSLGKALIVPADLVAPAPSTHRFLQASVSQRAHGDLKTWSPLLPRAPPLRA